MDYLLIDGNNLVHRTYWTACHQAKINEHDNSTKNSNHIFYTLNAILSYARRYKPTKTYITWDERKGKSGENARNELHSEYKDGRSKDKDPHQNNDTIKEILRAIGIQSVYPLHLEADDIIAYATKELPGSKAIISVDRDFLQLIGPEVILYDAIRKTEFNVKTFEQLTGYNQDDWYTAKLLGGDKSDNVPGIKGFGKVKIRKYLDGEVELTSEQSSQMNDNDNIFRLDVYKDNPNEFEFYRRQFELDIDPDPDKFFSICNELGYNRIETNKSEWLNLFVTNNKLSKLFT